MHIAIYLVVLLVGLGVFAYTMYKRIQVLKLAGSVDVRNNVEQRLMGVMRQVFGQQRMLHGDITAGLMHFLIFWGFVVVLLNTFHFLVGGFTGGEFHLPLLGRDQPLGTFYLILRDLFEVLVLGAVLYALWRRLVTRPARLKLSVEANLILTFIAILMVTDFIMGGCTMIEAGGEGWFSPMERLMAMIFSGLNLGTAGIVYTTAWWVHLVTLLIFLNLLPLGKHFHVLLSVFEVYFRKLTPMGELPTMDLEDEDLENFGSSKLEHLTWKNWFDGYNCTECGRCDHFCPANSTGKQLSPRSVITGTRDRIYECQPNLLKALALGANRGDFDVEEEMPAFVGEVHTDEVLWACTTCGACDVHCPLMIEHVEPIVQMRRHLVLEEEGRFPKELVATFNGLERQGNPWSIGAHQRNEWAEGLEVPTLSENPQAEYVYFVGCMASLDERNKATARAMVKLLKQAGVSFAILDAETCCGDPARRCGNEYLAQALIEMNAEQFREGKVKKVVTACPHCFNTLKNEYQQFGVEFDEVLHHGQLLMRLIDSGKLKPGSTDRTRFVYHDSCYLGRYNSVYYQPRDILRSVRGVELTEAQFNRDKGYCCGAGGGMMFMEETEGTRVNHWRYAQLRATGATEIGVACPFCMAMLDDAARDKGDDTKVRDIALILLDSMEE